MQPEPFTYVEVGATAGELPSGYRYLAAARVLGTGRELFDDSVEKLMSWGVQKGAGLVVASDARVTVGAEQRIGIRFGPIRTWAPCRVVYVVDEPNRKGFAYGTLPGHPESGEESFVLTLAEDGTVELAVEAFSRPARWFSRLGGPLTRWVQRRVTWRYLNALR